MRRDTKIAAAVFTAIPILILGAATSCTWAISRGASMEWRVLFRVMCHGLVSRCLFLWDVPMPLCARCVAIYAGLFLGLISFLFMPWVSERVLRIGLVAAAVPMAIDGLTQLMRFRESTNGLRFATGIAAGFAFGIWALSAIENRGQRAFELS